MTRNALYRVRESGDGRREFGVYVPLGGGAADAPRLAAFDPDLLLDEVRWGVRVETQLALRRACRVVGGRYPAATRVEAVDVMRDVLGWLGLPTPGAGDVARMLSEEDLTGWTALHPLTRYLLDSTESPTLVGPRSSSEFLWHRLHVRNLPRDARPTVERMVAPSGSDVAALALLMVTSGVPGDGEPKAATFWRLLEDERRDLGTPLPEEISPLDVHAEAYNRAAFAAVDMAYPPGTRADAVNALIALRQLLGKRPLTAEAAAEFMDPPGPVLAPRLAGFDADQLYGLFVRAAAPMGQAAKRHG